MDKNCDGYNSRDDAKDATWTTRFTELDKDNDGRLSQSEFNAMQAGAGATGAPLTSGTNAPDRKPSTPKQ
jgi:Ca2+-binding EF-hand superfamily protein